MGQLPRPIGSARRERSAGPLAKTPLIRSAELVEGAAVWPPLLLRGLRGRVRLCHLDEPRLERFNRAVMLYALLSSGSDLAVDVFLSREAAELALSDVLFDEPTLAPLLAVVAIPPPWQGRECVVLEPCPH